ncbi:MAG TPA: cbb3-type cytochrome c oxidase N-terminal domain-containing protein [Anaeromyxobacteraceae bacterium]|nr:cbb3-type cytochrome c oxidase N-terminal domain-containing protein [Anaeromyxobacteraceae bacterium]
MAEEKDDFSVFESPKETANKLPVGWLVLMWGLIVWGLYYVWAYTPALGGWSQSQDLEGGAASGTNLLATVAFTAIPTVVAVVLILAQRAKRK